MPANPLGSRPWPPARFRFAGYRSQLILVLASRIDQIGRHGLADRLDEPDLIRSPSTTTFAPYPARASRIARASQVDLLIPGAGYPLPIRHTATMEVFCDFRVVSIRHIASHCGG
jgi:hypothetical protein